MLFLKNICKIYLGQAISSASKAADAVSYSTGIAIRRGIQSALPAFATLHMEPKYNKKGGSVFLLYTKGYRNERKKKDAARCPCSLVSAELKKGAGKAPFAYYVSGSYSVTPHFSMRASREPSSRIFWSCSLNTVMTSRFPFQAMAQ